MKNCSRLEVNGRESRTAVSWLKDDKTEAYRTYMTLTNENVLDLVFFFTGVLLLFRKVAQMERHHTVRVFLLTAVLSCGVIFFFLLYGFTLGNPAPWQDSCDPQQFCLTE